MNRKYNDNFINEFSEDSYNKYLKTINYLDILRNNYNCRYDESYKGYDGTVDLFKESLDHYVLMKMENDNTFINSIECDNYFGYLKKLSNVNRYDFYTNIVLFNVLNNSKFIKYKEKYGLNNQMVDKKFGKAMMDINHIILKVRHNKLVTQDELNLLCGFVSDYRENTGILNETVKYIFNNLTDDDSKLKCSPQVISAILTYIPYTCKMLKKNNFEPSNVRIFAANKYNFGKIYNSMGTSLGSRKEIILNGKVVKNTNFKSIVSSENPFSFKEYFKYKDYSFTLMLMTVYHEMTHQYQNHMSRMEKGKTFINYDFFKDGLAYAFRNMLDDKLNDYNENHDNDDIEIHATKFAWEMCSDFYRDILFDSDLKKVLLTRCNKNKNGTLTRYSFAVKKDKNGNLIETTKYDLDNILRIMQDSKKRNKYFKTYPYLQYIFDNDGKIKLDILFIKNFGYTRIGASLLRNLINSRGIDSNILNVIKGKNKSDIIDATSNIYVAIDWGRQMLYHLNWYVEKNFNDDFKVNRSFLEVAKNIIMDQINVISNGKRLLHQVFRCYDYDDLIDGMREKNKYYYDLIYENINKSNNLSNKGIRR